MSTTTVNEPAVVKIVAHMDSDNWDNGHTDHFADRDEAFEAYADAIHARLTAWYPGVEIVVDGSDEKHEIEFAPDYRFDDERQEVLDRIEAAAIKASNDPATWEGVA